MIPITQSWCLSFHCSFCLPKLLLNPHFLPSHFKNHVVIQFLKENGKKVSCKISENGKWLIAGTTSLEEVQLFIRKVWEEIDMVFPLEVEFCYGRMENILTNVLLPFPFHFLALDLSKKIQEKKPNLISLFEPTIHRNIIHIKKKFISPPSRKLFLLFNKGKNMEIMDVEREEEKKNIFSFFLYAKAQKIMISGSLFYEGWFEKIVESFLKEMIELQ